MRARVILAGIVGGLILGGGVLVLRSILNGATIRPSPLGEEQGTITRVVMQYHPDAANMVIPIYRQFLSKAGQQLEVVWVVGKAEHAVDLQQRLGEYWPAGRCRTVVAGKPISTWAKDRFVALAVRGQDTSPLLCAPARRYNVNPLRANDQEVPYVLAQHASRSFEVRGVEADFDGGDFLATKRHFFASPMIFDKNRPAAASRFRNVDELKRYLERMMSRNITWLGEKADEAPPHHVGMYMTVMGNLAAVGDIRLAEAIAAEHPTETATALQTAGGAATPKFRTELTASLDRVALRLRELGYSVVRVPLLPSAASRAWMSYNNGIVETRDGTTIFYMPTFGAPALDAAAARMFRREMHCRVVPIDCAAIWHLGGSLHCLVNVVGRQ